VNRISLVTLALLIAFGALAYRMVDLQIVRASYFQEAARRQRTQMTTLQPQRGAILDRDGEILAFSKDVYSLYATPYQVKDVDGAAAQLALVLKVPQSDIAAKLRSGGGFVWLQRQLDQETARQVEELGLPGFGFIKESKRYYPQECLAAAVLGYVGIDNVGLAGLELQYDGLLRGEEGEIQAERDPTGEAIPGMTKVIRGPRDGRDLVLTLDMDIQYKAEVELAAAVQASEAKGGNLVVMDLRNGEILAMATFPGFDANLFGRTPPELTRNRPVTDAFEPGSVLKVVTASAALGEQLVAPGSVIHIPSKITIGEYDFKDAHEPPSSDLTFSDVIAHSSNLGTIKVASQLNAEVQLRYLKEMGCGSPTGVDFPGEVAGVLPGLDKWTATTGATLAIGQGVSVSTLQLACILGCVGNRGVMVTPHFLKQAVDRDTGEQAEFPWEPREVLGPDVCAKLKGILEQVVHHGTATLAATDLYNVAGKTGTAMKPNPNGKGYLKSYIATFAGFAPSEDPRLVVVVTLDEPATVYGGVSAAPCFSAVTEFALQQLRVPPSEEKVNTKDRVRPE
jgi:cell division protein FtsI (penicillin-binding protein 3)